MDCPVEVLADSVYIEPCTPFIFCSNGLVTESSTVYALAPV